MTPPSSGASPLSGNPQRVVVVDAGVGNLGNLRRALERLGAEVEVTASPKVVEGGRCLVLPGVGAFRPPRETLRGGLEEGLRAALDQGAWLLGICVGFQLLFESSDEFGATDGLGLLPGRVEKLPATVPLPHIGWNRLRRTQDHPLLRDLDGVQEPRAANLGAADSGAYVYFVHSYAPVAVPPQVQLAETLHGRPFSAVAGEGRILGTQFHPEKSGAVGLRLLKNFLELSWS